MAGLLYIALLNLPPEPAGVYGSQGPRWVRPARLERAERVADALEVGQVWINSVQAVFVETSWGGTKGSGIGRELGPRALSAHQSVKHVTRCLG